VSRAIVMNIRHAKKADEDVIWRIFQEVVSPGNTYVFSSEISREEALSYWMGDATHCYVLEEAGEILGTYIIKDNQPALGAHVANASFMVSSEARGKGVGEAMGLSALRQAKELGYRAMQFNMVVSTNAGAVRLWKKLGFKIVGTVPEVFRHRELGFVDAHIMHRFL